mgnify:FL=1|jgi:superfamily I DNA/RNA helicase
MNGTNEQIEIWNEMENGDGHLVIFAGAGTGKTYTIVEGSKLLNGKMAFLCFNKSIQTELADRLPDNVEAKTFHALGFAALRNSGIRTKVNNFKVKNICDELLGKDFNAAAVRKLVSLVKGSRIDPNNKGEIYSLIDSYDINFGSDREESISVESIPTILEMCKNRTHEIDFDDMIWLPLELDIPFPTFDTVFVDEAQDFNEMQREMILKCVNGGRCIVVGDPNQAIYGFRGADSDSMEIFCNELEKSPRGLKKFPLSLSWRCPVNVVKEANRYVKEFYANTDAENGTVIENAPFSPVAGDMVLCRYNAPLVNAFYELILAGKSAYVLGRDMTKGLINGVKKITKNMSMGSDEFLELLMEDFRYNYNRLIALEKENQANNLEDRVNCLKIFATKATTVGGIISEIERVFDGNENGEIMLSTVHKAKGLESNNVYVLATERMPHPKATNPKEERNICYVAITRAKKNLFYCGPRPKN